MTASRGLLALLLVALAALLTACGGDESEGASAGDGLSVVATTTHVADLARNVAGDRATVDALLEPNSDPHDYEPRPSDATALAEGDLVLRSGGEVDAWLADLVESTGSGAPAVSLIEAVETIEGGHVHEEGEEEHAGEDTDPHWWQDPRNAIAAVERIRVALAEADPEGAATYRANAAAYVERLRALDAAIAGCLSTVPAEDRRLVTNHDALGYLAHRYDLEVAGTVIPALTTRAQPSAGEVADLVRTIEEEEVRTIFPESQLDPELERAIARESGARVGPALWTDALGPEGSTGSTYLDAMAFNARAVADGLGARGCELPR